MSANNEILIYKKDNKWRIKYGELNEKFPKFNDIKYVIKEANRFLDLGKFSVEKIWDVQGQKNGFNLLLRVKK